MKSEELVFNERTLVSSISTCRRSLRFHSVFTEPRRYFHDAFSDAFKQCCYLIHWIVHTHTLTHTLSNACKTQMESVVTLPFPVISNMNSCCLLQLCMKQPENIQAACLCRGNEIRIPQPPHLFIPLHAHLHPIFGGFLQPSCLCS